MAQKVPFSCRSREPPLLGFVLRPLLRLLSGKQAILLLSNIIIKQYVTRDVNENAYRYIV